MNKLKVATIIGTRPEIIKLSRVIPKLDTFADNILVNTKQNYSANLNDDFFRELRLRKPNYTLDISDNVALSSQLGAIFTGIENIFIKEHPDAILILGDTNSGLSSIIAKRHKIPIFHMEAGNRCFDENVPEEINRKIIDHISEINLAYTEQSRLNLLQEGIKPGTIYVTGSPLAEVIRHYLRDIRASQILKKMKLSKGKYFVVSLHREENVDNEKTLIRLIDSIGQVSRDFRYPIIFSVHPRTKDRIAHFCLKLPHTITYLDAFGFFDYCKLQMNSYCVLSDSGTIQEESAILGFPAVQLRTSSERPEAFDKGSIILSGHESGAIKSGIHAAVALYDAHKDIPEAYKELFVSDKVVKLIIGLGSVMRQNLTDFHRRLFY